MLLYLGLAPTLGLGVMGCNNETNFGDTVTDMGRSPMRRMNRQEYDLTIRHVLGVDTSSIEVLPPDEEAFDYLVMADFLSVSPYHIESYETVIDQALTEFFGPFEATYAIELEGDWASHNGGRRDGRDWWIIGEDIATNINLQFGGTYEVGILGYAYDGVQPYVSVWVDNSFVTQMDFTAPGVDLAQLRTVELDLSEGAHSVRIQREAGGFASMDFLQFRGPIDPVPSPSPALSKIVTCHPDDAGDACVDEMLAAFLERAWRGPQDAEALAWARALYDEGALASEGIFEEGLRLAFKGILMAPDFLYREEVGASQDAELARPLDDYEVANRLSYFLWSTVPDDRLYQAAEAGELGDAAGVVEQARRMLADERSEALVDTFATQWFDIDRLASFSPDPNVYRAFGDELRASMVAELRGLAQRFVKGDIDLYELLTTQESLIDQQLADHYLVLYAGGNRLTNLELTGRVGLLGTAGWQMAHSHPAMPSVVQRGKYVLGRLLCDQPPPPPPDINQDQLLVEFLGSVRFQEEAQRLGEPCVACHKVMDPIGHALGGFDAIGHERNYDELGHRVDTQVDIEGTPAAGLPDLAAWVASDSRYPRCVVEQTFMFALGRPAGDLDQANLDAITDRFLDQGATFPALLDALTAHSVFRHRAAIPEEVLP